MEQLTDYSIVTQDETIMNPIPVLDKGFVQLVDWNGSDKRIVEAARISYQEGTKRVRRDADLIDYLMRHNHTSPFELVNFTFAIKMPLFVAAQWKRHRTAKMNEQSARYSEILDEFYVPLELRRQDSVNKQGSEGRLEPKLERSNIEAMQMSFDTAYAEYKRLLEDGVAREQARIVLPQSTYTIMMWQIDLHNLMHLLKLREDKHAQSEIQEYARAILGIISRIVPLTFQAFVEHRWFSVTFSHTEMRILQSLLEQVPQAYDALNNAAEMGGFRETRRKEFLNKVFTIHRLVGEENQ